MEKKPNIAFFGTPDRAVIALDALKRAGMMPSLVITQPDRPQGRKLILTPPPAKVWAEKEGVSVLQPENLADKTFKKTLVDGKFDFFVVVAYGKIIKQDILDMPRFGSINLHASLLPRLRGASPIETAILTDERPTGVTIILMDKFMDHGPILAQAEVATPHWPLPAEELARLLCERGGELLVESMKGIMTGSIKPIEQDHSKATLAKKIAKEDGLMDLSADAYKNFLKWNAYKTWPKSYMFVGAEKTRVTITDAAFEEGRFVIKKVIPEGKKEMTWTEFERGNK
ncbi:MAG TPA: methionyl-tRNA formyltransferase [Candidatus Paceibacterota bacterium]|jgi:methionyl-tRNA formyltransferase|nr:methionyl-tRNA formyltransferase [Candidatus Paceibacterota bacterium]